MHAHRSHSLNVRTITQRLVSFCLDKNYKILGNMDTLGARLFQCKYKFGILYFSKIQFVFVD